MSISPEYVIGVLSIAGIYLMTVLGLSLLTGFTGQFSFGHAGFMAIGAYSSAMMTNAGVPFIPALFAGALIAALISLVIGRFTLNLTGDYFCIATLGFGESMRLLFDNLQFFGGARGLICDMKTTPLIVLIFCILGILILSFLINSRHGRNFVAVREEELAASVIGINTFKYKMISFAISAAYAGISGGLLAHYFGYIRPIMFQLLVSQELAIIVIFGGMGSITGTVIGTLILKTLPEIFRSFSTWRLVVYGLVIVVIMIVRPKGIMGGMELTDLFKRKTHPDDLIEEE